MKDHICILPRHGFGKNINFNAWSCGNIAFWGSRMECDAFRDAYDTLFEGVAVCHAPGPLADAAEAGMELAIKHGARVHEEFAA